MASVTAPPRVLRKVCLYGYGTGRSPGVGVGVIIWGTPSRVPASRLLPLSPCVKLCQGVCVYKLGPWWQRHSKAPISKNCRGGELPSRLHTRSGSMALPLPSPCNQNRDLQTGEWGFLNTSRSRRSKVIKHLRKINVKKRTQVNKQRPAPMWTFHKANRC